MSKEEYVPLTINRLETKAKILATEKQLKSYAAKRRIDNSTLCRILLTGKCEYPFQKHRYSKFQKALRRLQADGYLVELPGYLVERTDKQQMSKSA